MPKSAGKAAFFQVGRFSNVNDRVYERLKIEFPDYRIDIIGIWTDLVRARDIRNVTSCVKEYGLDILHGRKKFPDCLSRTPHIFRKVKKRAEERIKTEGYDFTFQTQSIFDTSLAGTPHFVYTDHTELANLHYPGFSEKELFSRSWIELEKTIYSRASAVFTFSGNVARWLAEQYGIDPAKTECVRAGVNAVPPADWQPEEDRYKNNHILFVGGDWDRKGGPQLVRAFQRVQKVHPEARLTVVGCKPRIRLPNCSIVPAVSVSELSGFYRNASIFCMPSRIEPMGVAFVEAFFHFLPVVATSIGALPEIVAEGKSGYLVHPDDAEGLARRLIDLIESPARCESFGREGRRSVEGSYTWKAAAGRMAGRIRRFLK
jgi:glycosyltransferase involved in cell wall biosynthesis